MSLYQKYRPQTFGDITGQKHISETLQNALKLDLLSHAYLFCGREVQVKLHRLESIKSSQLLGFR